MMRPEHALAVCFPDVAETWHPDRNGDRTPEQISSKNDYRAWWRCAAGHVWQEIVATRTSLPAWKQGDVAACRVCVGYHVIVDFDCGHTTDAPAQFAEPERGCPACRAVRQRDREAAYRQRRAVSSAASKRLYIECRGRAQALVDALPVPELPPALLYEWRRTAVQETRGAIVREELFHKTGMVGTVLAEQRRIAAQLIPSVEELRAAIAAREPLRILGKAHWPAGWLHLLDGRTGGAASPDDTVLRLEATLTAEVATVVEQFGRDRQVRVNEVTALLTQVVARWADNQETKWRSHRWNVYRELSLPITPGGSTRFGRLDLTVMRPDHPDLVIEIDSAHNEQNAEKLAFACDAGAIAVWVRWHGGRVEAPEGVHRIDLVEASRGLAA